MKKTAEEVLKEIQNIEVDEYATPCSFTVNLNSSVADVMKLMEDNGIRHVPVLNGEKPVGIISDRDVRNIDPTAPLKAGDVMSDTPYTVSSGELLRDVVFEMSTKKIGSALVVNGDGLSIFTSVDALNALNEVLRGELL